MGRRDCGIEIGRMRGGSEFYFFFTKKNSR